MCILHIQLGSVGLPQNEMLFEADLEPFVTISTGAAMRKSAG